MKLDRLTPLGIQRFYSGLTASGLGPRRVHYVHAVLHSALEQAVKWRMLPTNPAEYVDLPRLERKEMRALTEAEAARFLVAAAEDRLGIVFTFALTTGCRPEEYLALRWADVDLKRGTVKIERVLVRQKGGGWTLEEPKASRSRRTIPLPTSMAKALAAHKVCQTEARLKVGPAWKDNGFVFAGEDGEPLHASNITARHFRPTLVHAGLARRLEDGKIESDIRLYDLRHSCATLLLASGENPKVVGERLGHASVTMTLDVYSHVLPHMQQGAADKLEAMLCRQ